MAIDGGTMYVDSNFIINGYCMLAVFIVLFAWTLPCYFLCHDILKMQCIDIIIKKMKTTQDESNLSEIVDGNNNSRKATISGPSSPSESSMQSSPSATSSSDKSKNTDHVTPKNRKRKLHLPISTKLALLATVILKYIYILKNCYITILLFVWPSYYSPIYCEIFFFINTNIFAIGRNMLYIFFIFRASDIFKGTEFAPTKCSKYALLTYIFCILLFTLCSSINYTFINGSITHILHIKNYGGYCSINNNGSDTAKRNAAFTGFLFILHEYFIEIITMYIMISRCFKLIFQSHINERNKMSNSNINSSTFHDVTSKDNMIILSATRIIILFIVSILSTQISWFLVGSYHWFGNLIYSFDDLIKVYCLFLTFSFSNKYYNKYFCGKQCTKCCFPVVKTLALTCNSNKHSNLNGCILCCCYCCRYCCIPSKRKMQSQIYKMAKVEIELVINQ